MQSSSGAAVDLRRAHDFFSQACAIAQWDLPVGVAQRVDFAQACVAAAKVKAELLGKALPHACPHHQLLDMTARLFGFPDWHGLRQFSKTFGDSAGDMTPRLTRSWLLAAALWQLSDADSESELVARLLALQRVYLRGVVPNEDELVSLILQRVLFRKTPLADMGQALRELTACVSYGLTDFLAYTPQKVLLALLARVPVRDGMPIAWPSLRSVSVAQILEMPLANEHHAGGFGFQGWEHAVVDMVSELDTFYPSVRSGYDTDRFHGDAVRHARQRELTKQIKSMACRTLVKDALMDLMSPFAKSSVLDLMVSREGPDGFFSSFYSGPPEKVESDWASNYHIHEVKPFKRLAFRAPFHGEFQLSIFRLRRHFETPGPRLYEFEAVLHDSSDTLVAKVGLALFIGNGATTPVELAWALDEHDLDDLREIALGLAQAVYCAEIDEHALDRVMIVRDWEVIPAFRGCGLGKELLNEAIQRSVKGLALPHIIAARMCPLSFKVPPFDAWLNNETSFKPLDARTELVRPMIEMRDIFARSIGPGSFVDAKGIQLFEAPYLPTCHMGDEMVLWSMHLSEPT